MKSILIIEDDKHHIVYLKYILRDLLKCYFVTEHDDILPTFNKIKNEIDFVLLDIRMGNKECFEFVNIVKDYNKDILVICNSATKHYKEKCKEMGFIFLQKPYSNIYDLYRLLNISKK
jgi:two-component SAPR family response regulator